VFKESTSNFFAREKLDSIYNPHYVPEPAAPFTKENVVVIILESFAREYIGFFNKDLEGGTYTGYTGNIYEDILNITAVHPLREETLLKLLQNNGAVYSVVDSLIHQHLIKSVIYEGNKYFIRDYHSAG